ncbi:MAG: histone deacetylase family protein [Pseudomonadota bacterium]
MKAFFDPAQQAHDPKHFLVAGTPRPCPETPHRASLLTQGAKDAGCVLDMPPDAGMGPIAAVHPSRYLTFLENVHARWIRLDGASDEVIPNVHPLSRNDSYPSSAIGQAGFHMADTACPIGPHTFRAAYAAAQTAVAAADATALSGTHSYALCRPPGHHACIDRAGGFSFLNNAAIATERLIRKGWRIAILDIDVHHGNGTQDIFYDRGDVLTVSIHTDPNAFYPFFRGHAHECGADEGHGANLNLPLPKGADLSAYRPALSHALDRIAAFGAQAIVVALGLDTHISDPFRGMTLETTAYTEIAHTLKSAELPLILVQEGGYVSDHLAINLATFLSALD